MATDKRVLTFQQASFQQGMNQQVDPTRLSPEEYCLLINGRIRYGVVEPILDWTTADPQNSIPEGTRQGAYAAGRYLIVFVNGAAYYRDVETSEVFSKVAGFQMSADASEIYACLVPASTVNFQRKRTSVDSQAVSLTSSIAGSPQCLVVQDGINQPYLIFDDGSCRKAQTYDEWSNTLYEREYVPIGKMMLYKDGILYIVANSTILDGQSGKSITLNNRVILRSVTGRPLDFVVNVSYPDGDKGGDAYTTAHAVDYDEITCLAHSNSNDGSFICGTNKNTYLVLPNTTVTIFNEPTFKNILLFSTGPLNNNAITDVTGDAALIDYTGVRSFNAVMQNRNAGKNLPFYARVALLFNSIVQDIVASTTFDDYALFSVNTIFGRGVLVYDTILQTWVSLDLYNETILQFAEVRTTQARELYARTANGIYKLYSGTAVKTVSFCPPEWCSNNPTVEQRPVMLKLVFTDVEASTTVSVTPYTDRKANSTRTITVPQTLAANTLPLTVPFGVTTQDTVRSVMISLEQLQQCWKFGCLISWNTQANLTHVMLVSDSIQSVKSDEQASTAFV